MAAAGPTLTVKSMAEILHMPPEKKARILRRQKYPKEGSQKFRTPYYSLALAGIRGFYENGSAALVQARNKIEGIPLESRRDNNKRVLDSFEGNVTQFERELKPQSNVRYMTRLSSVQLKLSADLRALENDAPRYIYYHCKSAALTGRLAEDTVQIGHWLLEREGIRVSIYAIEFIDLFSGKVFSVRSRSAGVEKMLRENARVIADLWPNL